MMHFTVEEENLICMYHNADRRRTIGKITAAMPSMDGDRYKVFAHLCKRAGESLETGGYQPRKA